MEATNGLFSYLFINLTHECNPKLKYLSHLFNNLVMHRKSTNQVIMSVNNQEERNFAQIEDPFLDSNESDKELYEESNKSINLYLYQDSNRNKQLTQMLKYLVFL